MLLFPRTVGCAHLELMTSPVTVCVLILPVMLMVGKGRPWPSMNMVCLLDVLHRASLARNVRCLGVLAHLSLETTTLCGSADMDPCIVLNLLRGAVVMLTAMETLCLVVVPIMFRDMDVKQGLETLEISSMTPGVAFPVIVRVQVPG